MFPVGFRPKEDAAGGEGFDIVFGGFLVVIAFPVADPPVVYSEANGMVDAVVVVAVEAAAAAADETDGSPDLAVVEEGLTFSEVFGGRGIADGLEVLGGDLAELVEVCFEGFEHGYEGS